MGYNRPTKKMKKFTFIFVALFAATFANAQITLEHTSDMCHPASNWNREDQQYHIYGASELPCPFLVEYTKIKEADELHDAEYSAAFIYPSDYSVYKSINNSLLDHGKIVAISYDVFAVDKIAWLYSKYDPEHEFVYIIQDEDGNVLLDLGAGWDLSIWINKYNSNWFLTVEDYKNGVTKIYSLPGDGSEPQKATEVSSPSCAKRDVRKIIRNGQVLVEAENNYYTIEGQEVK